METVQRDAPAAAASLEALARIGAAVAHGESLAPVLTELAEAEVVAVGKGTVTEEGKQFPLDVKKGDRILIGKYAGTEIKIDDIEHLILREDEVLAVVEK